MDGGVISPLFFFFYQFEPFHRSNKLVAMSMKQVQNDLDQFLIT
ncbi:hypothetical protein BFZC1_14853 [Lysinibacillus fusiformis ZC1]|nr:hypothetical protein BFZC1_14853 [Lysinibacillus fusiformis ZC1]